MWDITNNSEVEQTQVEHFMQKPGQASQSPSYSCQPDDDVPIDQTSTMNSSLPSPEFNLLSARAHGYLGDDFGMYPWGMVGLTGSRRMGSGPTSQTTILHHTNILNFTPNDHFSHSHLDGVGPMRGLRVGGRRGWCEEWARSG
jgi:hypothetical protein